MPGKTLRLRRVFNSKSGKTLIVPLDHGVSSGPLRGIEKMSSTIQKVVMGGADAIILHRGYLKRMAPFVGRMGIIMHLSASADFSPLFNKKVQIGEVEEAVRLGADAISVHINLGGKYDDFMLETLGKISREAEEWGMPLLAMMYPRGEVVRDEQDIELLKHVVRIADEFGADIIKTNFSKDDRFADVVKGCSVPVVIAGGPPVSSDLELLSLIEHAMSLGVAGVAIGRNVFQHSRPEILVKSISKIVHNGWSAEKAREILREAP